MKAMGVGTRLAGLGLAICVLVTGGATQGATAKKSQDVYIVVRRGGSVRNVDDLPGKRICLGPREAESHAEATLQALKSLYNYIPVPGCDRLRFSEMVEQLQRGESEAFFLVGETPLGQIRQALDDGAIWILSYPDTLIRAMNRPDPGRYSALSLRAEDYPAIKNEQIRVARVPFYVMIGAVYPLSGTMAIGGNGCRGHHVAAEEINVKGGFDGYPVKVTCINSAVQPDKVIEGLRQLARDERLLAVVVGSVVGGTGRFDRFAENEKVPLIFQNDSAAYAASGPAQWTFRLNPSPASSAAALEQFLQNDVSRITTVAVLSVDLAPFTDLATAFEQRFREKGYKIVFRERFQPKSPEFAPLLNRAASVAPDLVLIAAGADSTSQLIRQARDSSLRPKMFVGTGDGLGGREFAANAGPARERVFFVGPWSENSKHPRFAQLGWTFQQRFNEELDAVGIDAYMATQLIVDSLRRARSLTRDGLRLALDKADASTLVGPVRFDFSRYGRQFERVMSVNQWQKGTTVTVWPKDIAQTEPSYP